MRELPLVSVVVPTYNRKKYVIRAIDSVLRQTYKNIEIIIADDCSTDRTQEAIFEHYSKDPRIITFKNEINLGFPENLNKGVAIAQGKYIARIDDDDFWSDNKKMEKQVNFLENHPDYVLVGGGAIWVNEDGKEIFKFLLPEKDEDIRRRILSDDCFVHSTVVFKKNAWESARGYNKQLGTDCDWGLWLELGKLGKFYNFPEYFTYYLKWTQNVSNFNPKSNFRIRIELCKKYCKDYPGRWKAFFLGWAYYLYLSLLRGRKLGATPVKIRTLIFGPPPYK
jgi:glycosyltransferase involved in cell wall biosynthesis